MKIEKYYQERLETGSLFLEQADIKRISNTLVTKVPENLLKL